MATGPPPRESSTQPAREGMDPKRPVSNSKGNSNEKKASKVDSHSNRNPKKEIRQA